MKHAFNSLVLGAVVCMAVQLGGATPSFGGGGDISRVHDSTIATGSPRQRIYARLNTLNAQVEQIAGNSGYGNLSPEALTQLSGLRARQSAVFAVADRVEQGRIRRAYPILAIIDQLKRDMVGHGSFVDMSAEELNAYSELRALESDIFATVD